jgi:DNA polymerase III sliding clamp (beta) subunit (PCNA family)
MKHFAIKQGRVHAYNGRVALSSPIPFDLDCYPKAETLYKAIQNCDETVQMSLTTAGKLKVVSGDFKAMVPCLEKSELHSLPSGDIVEVDGEALLEAFKLLEPFTGDDASRPWANGILLKDGCAHATCNVVLVQYWLGLQLPEAINIPFQAVREVLRVNEAPSQLQLDKNSVTFHFTDGRWIKTSLFENWPNISPILDKISNDGLQPVDTRIFEALKKLKPFTDKTEQVIFTVGAVSTHVEESEEGGRIALPGSTMTGIYSLSMVMLLKDVATHVDFSTYPNPCSFHGKNLRGAIIGRRA